MQVLVLVMVLVLVLVLVVVKLHGCSIPRTRALNAKVKKVERAMDAHDYYQASTTQIIEQSGFAENDVREWLQATASATPRLKIATETVADIYATMLIAGRLLQTPGEKLRCRQQKTTR